MKLASSLSVCRWSARLAQVVCAHGASGLRFWALVVCALGGSGRLFAASTNLPAPSTIHIAVDTNGSAIVSLSSNQLTAFWAYLSAHITSTATNVPFADLLGAPTNNGALAAELAAKWSNPASATNWQWTSDGTQITLTNYTGPTDVVIPDMLDGLPVTGFGVVFSPTELGSAVTSVSGGKNVTTIEYGAFMSCTGLVSVSLPAATSIKAYAFAECTALASVSLPAVTSIGVSGFQDCTALTSVSFPDVTSVGEYAFTYCTALVAVYFAQNAPVGTSNVYHDVAEFSTVTNYVTNPQATGWGATWNGMPVVRLTTYASESYVGPSAGTNLPVYATLTNHVQRIAASVPYTGATNNVDLNAKSLQNVGSLEMAENAGSSLISLPSTADNRIWARGGISGSPYVVPYLAVYGTNSGAYTAWLAFYSPSNIVLSTSGTLARRELTVSSNLVAVSGALTLNNTNVLVEPPTGAVYARSNGTWIAIGNAIVAVTTPLTVAAATNGHIVTYTVALPTNAVTWRYGTYGGTNGIYFTPADGTNRWLTY